MATPVEAARAKRAEKQAELEALVATATAEERMLTVEEGEKVERLTAKIDELDARIKSTTEADERLAKAAAASVDDPGVTVDGQVRVKSEQMTYTRFGEHSFMRDLAAIGVPQSGFDRIGAEQRMAQHHKELTIEARHNPEMRRNIDESLKRRGAFSADESRSSYESRAINGTYGTGGEFIPPVWLESLYAQLLRPGRVFADRVTHEALPPGTNSINVPKILSGTSVAIQATQGSAVSSTDITTSFVTAPVNTVAGQEDMSLQLLEQSPLGMDGVIFDDLHRAYNAALDVQIIAGSGTAGQHLGVLSVAQNAAPSVSQAQSVTVSSAVFHDNSTSGTQFRSVVNAVNAVETRAFAGYGPTAIWVHPRRSNSWAYASDGQNRPLFIPAKYGQFNALGTAESGPVPEGVAGELFGLPVVKDSNMPTTMLGTAVTGGTADAVVVLNESVPILWEGAIRFRALPEILSGTLQVRFQAYAYSAFLPHRFLPCISILTGNTGLAAPGF